jgi:lipopolysaccharide biosynthesis glycosyltransferase
VGYDPREAVAYHVFCQSVIEKASRPVAFYPLHRGLLENFDGQRDGTNAFIFSRFLVPSLCNFMGWALFFDGDMVCNADVAELWDMRDDAHAVHVVQHDYQTKNPRKYIGTKLESANVDYPRKNWSSVILWNCWHSANRKLTRPFIEDVSGQFLHRFEWLRDNEVGALPHDWNHLVGEDAPSSAYLHHYTLGVPGMPHYADCQTSWRWHDALIRALECAGVRKSQMVKRAEDRVGEL